MCIERKMIYAVRIIAVTALILCVTHGALYGVSGMETGHTEQDRNSIILEYGDPVITGIRITGLKRTHASVVRNFLDVSPGMRLSEFNPRRFTQELHHTKLFKRINLRYIRSEDGVEIEVSLVEKWTLIPIPMIVRTKSTETYGLFIYEANFLGYNKKLFLGGMYTNFGWTLNGGYIDPGIAGSGFVMRLFAKTGDMVFENVTVNTGLYQRYRARFSDVRFGFGYEFFRRLAVTVESRFRDFSVDLDDGDAMLPPDSVRSSALGFRLHYRDLHYTGFSNEGVDITADYLRGVPWYSDCSCYNEVLIRGRAALSLNSDNLVYVWLNGGAGNLPEVLHERIGGRTGFKTLAPQQVAASGFYSAVPSYETAVYHASWSTVTVVAFYEGGAFKQTYNGWSSFHGPGCGVRVYLKSVAFPAFGFDYAYNVPTGNSEVSAAIGFSM